MAPAPPVDPISIVVLQPVAVVDHVCSVDVDTLHRLVGNDVGGSKRCTLEELQAILAAVGDFHSKAGGSASNVGRALARGFGSSVDVVGSRGNDEWGVLFLSSMRRSGARTDRIRVHNGPTGRSAILTCNGQRTMRTFLQQQVQTSKEMLGPQDFEGASWAFFSAYSAYSPGLLERAVQLANEAGVRVVLDLASYEIVTTYHQQLLELLSTGSVYCCIANEDEALALARVCGLDTGQQPHKGPNARCEEGVAVAHLRPVLDLLLRHCAVAVVTRGVQGCLAASAAQREPLAVPAATGVSVTDTTGAGDHFTAGLMYGLMLGWPLQRCCEVACLSGAAAVRCLGAELTAADWSWFHARLHGDLAGEVVEGTNAEEVAQELLGCYALIERLGRGAVYFGSARLAQASPYYERSVELAEQVAALLRCPTWTGGGPGMMRAASEGGLAAGLPVGGIRISKEAGTSVLTMEDYLQPGCSFTCKHLPARKVALTDAGTRTHAGQRTAYVFLPGGLGTCDELFSILTLMQLGKLGSKLPVPLVIANYDGFYDGLLSLMQAFDRSGALHSSEVRQVMVASTNEEILEYLAGFYGLQIDYDIEDDPKQDPALPLVPPSPLERLTPTPMDADNNDNSRNGSGASTPLGGRNLSRSSTAASAAQALYHHHHAGGPAGRSPLGAGASGLSGPEDEAPGGAGTPGGGGGAGHHKRPRHHAVSVEDVLTGTPPRT